MCDSSKPSPTGNETPLDSPSSDASDPDSDSDNDTTTFQQGASALLRTSGQRNMMRPSQSNGCFVEWFDKEHEQDNEHEVLIDDATLQLLTTRPGIYQIVPATGACGWMVIASIVNQTVGWVLKQAAKGYEDFNITMPIFEADIDRGEALREAMQKLEQPPRRGRTKLWFATMCRRRANRLKAVKANAKGEWWCDSHQWCTDYCILVLAHVLDRPFVVLRPSCPPTSPARSSFFSPDSWTKKEWNGAFDPKTVIMIHNNSWDSGHYMGYRLS